MNRSSKIWSTLVVASLAGIASALPQSSVRLPLSAHWQSSGPLPGSGPRATVFAESLADPDRLYAGTAAGLAVSEDGGRSWTLRELPEILLGFVTASHADPDLVLFWGPQSDLFRSEDAGRTFTKALSFPAGQGRNATFARSVPGRVYVTANSGLWRSDDAGLTFEQLDGGSWAPGAPFVDPVDADHVLVAIRNRGIHESTDGGHTWELHPFPDDVPYALAFNMHPRDPARWLIADEDVHLSEDGGRSWRTLGTGAQYVDAVAFDAYDSQRLFALDRIRGVLRTVDGGASWQVQVDRELDTSGGGAAWMTGSGLVPGRVFLGISGGIFGSDSGGDSWFRANHGLENAATVLGVERSPHHRSVLVALTGGSVYRTGDGGRTWIEATGFQHLGTTGGNSLAADPHRRGRWFVVTLAGKVYRSDDDGRTFVTAFDFGIPVGVSQIASHPGVQDRLFATTIGTGTAVWRSDDGGASFVPVGPAANWSWALAISPADPDRMYCSDARGVLISDDGGSNWRRSTTQTPNRVITPHPFDREVAWVTGGYQGVWQTTDGGDTWTALPAPLDQARAAEPVFGGFGLLAGDALNPLAYLYLPHSGQTYRLGHGLVRPVSWFLATDRGIWAATLGGGLQVLR